MNINLEIDGVTVKPTFGLPIKSLLIVYATFQGEGVNGFERRIVLSNFKIIISKLFFLFFPSNLFLFIYQNKSPKKIN